MGWAWSFRAGFTTAGQGEKDWTHGGVLIGFQTWKEAHFELVSVQFSLWLMVDLERIQARRVVVFLAEIDAPLTDPGLS